MSRLVDVIYRGRLLSLVYCLSFLFDVRMCELTSRDGRKQEHFKPTTLAIVWCMENNADRSVSPVWQRIRTKVTSHHLSRNIKGRNDWFPLNIWELIPVVLVIVAIRHDHISQLHNRELSVVGCLMNLESFKRTLLYQMMLCSRVQHPHSTRELWLRLLWKEVQQRCESESQ